MNALAVLHNVMAVLVAMIAGKDKPSRAIAIDAIASALRSAGADETPENWVVFARRLAPSLTHVFAPSRFAHDCPNCVYLGREGSRDLYFCPGEVLGARGSEVVRNASALARYGSEGPEYTSFPSAEILMVPERGGLGLAMDRAIALGLCDQNGQHNS